MHSSKSFLKDTILVTMVIVLITVVNYEAAGELILHGAQQPSALEFQTCVFEFLPVDVDFVPTGTVASVVLSTASDMVLVFSAETRVAPGGRMDVQYSVDGGPPQIAGPELFSSDSDQFATRTALGVINVPAGSHTIEPVVRSTTPGAGLFFRCFHVRRSQ